MASMASRAMAATSGLSVLPFNLAKFFYVSHAIHANDILINFFAAAPAGMAAPCICQNHCHSKTITRQIQLISHVEMASFVILPHPLQNFTPCQQMSHAWSAAVPAVRYGRHGTEMDAQDIFLHAGARLWSTHGCLVDCLL